MKKKEKLRDGEEVVIREWHREDMDRSYHFFNSLPKEERRYLRIDVTDRKQLEKKLSTVETGDDVRLIALQDDEIIGQGTLEISPEGWRESQGELRVFVAEPYRLKGLGTILIRELYFIGVQRKLKMIVAKLMRPQQAAKKICRSFGFQEELMIPNYVTDRDGHLQDLVIMVCDIDEMWQRLEEHYEQTDWRRCR